MTDTTNVPPSPIPTVLRVLDQDGNMIRMARLDFALRSDRALTTAELRWAAERGYAVTVAPADWSAVVVPTSDEE